MQEKSQRSEGPSSNLSTDALFTQYIDVVNRVIGENRDGLYGKIMKLWDRVIGGKQIGVGVYASDAKHPHHWYTVELSDGTFELVDNAKPEGGIDWKVSDDHLRHVVDNPQVYIDHPMRLDLDWLRTRVGLG